MIQEINTLFDLREKKKLLESELKILGTQIEELEISLLDKMTKDDVQSIKSSAGLVCINKSLKPSVIDWVMFYDYIYDSKSIHLLERRPAVNAYRSLRENDITVPGVDDFVKISLNFRKA